jgi:hypothetical protein
MIIERSKLRIDSEFLVVSTSDSQLVSLAVEKFGAKHAFDRGALISATALSDLEVFLSSQEAFDAQYVVIDLSGKGIHSACRLT